MKATKARKIFNKLNESLSLKEKIKRDIKRGLAGTSISRINENNPELKKLENDGYLITHSDSYTYITWAN